MQKRSFLRKSAVSLAATLGLGTLGSDASAQITLPPNLTIGVETIQPGLLEGRLAGAFNETAPNSGTGGILLSPEKAYTNQMPPWGTDETWVYTGQMFFPDNGAMDGLSQFSLAEHIDDNVLLRIDGVQVLRNTNWDVATSTGARTIPAGWHNVDFRFAHGGGGAGATGGGGNGGANGWTTDFGFGVDFTTPIEGGINRANYTKVEDPGNATVLRVATYNVDDSRDNQNVNVTADATLTILQGRVVPLGSLTVANNTTFSLDSRSTTTFTQTNLPAASTFNVIGGVITTGPLRSSGAVTSLTKTGAGELNVSTAGGSNVTAIGDVNVNGGTLAIGVGMTGTSVGTSPINLNGGTLALSNDFGVPGGRGTFSTIGDFWLDNDIFSPILPSSTMPDSSNGVGWAGLDTKAQFDAEIAAIPSTAPRTTVPVNTEINFPRGDANPANGGENDNAGALFNIQGGNLPVSLTGQDDFVARFAGKLNVVDAGPTEFLLMSNDGAAMFIDLDQGPGTNWTKVVDNNRISTGDGNFQGHYSGSAVAVADENLTPVALGGANIPNPPAQNLSAGVYDYILGFYNKNANEAGVELFWDPAGGTDAFEIVPNAAAPSPVTLNNELVVSGNSGLNVRSPSATLANLQMNPGSSLTVSGNPLTTAVTATGAGIVSIGSSGGATVNLTTLDDGGNAVNFSAGTGRVTLSRVGGPGPDLGATSSVGAGPGGTLVATNGAAGNTLAGAPVTLTGGTLELRTDLGPGTTKQHVSDAAFDGTFIEDVLDPGTTPNSNYLVFRGQTGPGFSLTTTPLIGGTARAPVNAVEIVSGTTRIPIKFGSNQPDGAGGDDMNSQVTGAAGVLNTPTWNNFGAQNEANPQPLNLVMSGTASGSGANVTWSSNGLWSSTGQGEENNTAPAGENRDLMAGYLDTGGLGGIGVTVTVTGLPAPFSSGPYDVYVYTKGGVNGRGGDYTVSSILPPPDFASNVNATENSTINVTGFTGARVGNVSVDAGKTLTIAGNRLTVDNVSAGAGGVVLFNSPQGNEVAGSLGGTGTITAASGRTVDFSGSAMSTGAPRLVATGPTNIGDPSSRLRFTPGAGNTFGGSTVTAIENNGILQATNGITDLSGATVTSTVLAPPPRAGLLEVTAPGGFNLGAVPLPADLSAATYQLELRSANTWDTDPDAARVYPANTTQVYAGEIFIPDTDGDGRAGPIAFGEHFDDGVLVRIDGQTLINNNNWDIQNDSGEFELAEGKGAGWYSFEARLGRGGGPNGPQAPWADASTPPMGFGIGIDTTAPFNPRGAVTDTMAQGSGSPSDLNRAAYTKPMDNGSMNLFRFALSGVGETRVDSGATLKVGALVNPNNVVLAADSRLELHGATSKIQNTALSLPGTPTAPTATLDVTDSALVLDYAAGANPSADVRSRIVAARGGTDLLGTWDGKGITSSNATAEPSTFSVGFANNADLPLGAYTEFRGQPVDDTSVLIRGTLIGDANLDGVVGDEDVTIVGATFGMTSGATWALGDFTYDGAVDDADVTLVSALYNPTAPPVGAPPVLAGAVAAVPEPATWLMLALGGLGAGLFGWRRRKAQQ